MISLISSAYAAQPAANDVAQGGASALSPIIMLVAFMAIAYFMLVRPQTKKAKEHQQLLQNLKTDDEVMTSGGILGQIVKVSEQFVVLKIADNLEIKMQKQAITGVLPKGTMKAL